MHVISWISHNRGDLLKRSVESFLTAVGERKSDYFFILAQSGQSQIQFSNIPSKDILYVNDGYRSELISYFEKCLQQKDFDKSIATFAFDANKSEGNEGVHRNLINLLTVGTKVLNCDDDVIFDVKRLPIIQESSGKSDHSFHSFKDWNEFDRFDSQCESVSVQDFLSMHNQLLDVSTFSSSGLRGHSIYGGPRFIFSLGSKAIEEYGQNTDFFNNVLSSRIIWNEARENYIAPYSSIATYSLGMNNNVLLPPCFPFGRNLDGSFIYSSKVLNPQIKTTHLKASVLHEPAEDRGAYGSLGTLDFRINDIIWLMWTEWIQNTPKDLSVPERYQSSGEYFQNETLSVNGFKKYLKKLISKNLLERASHLEVQYEKIKENQAVKKSGYLELLISEIKLCRSLSADSNVFIPKESFLNSFNEDEKIEKITSWISLYGKTIEAWPFIHSIIKNYIKDQRRSCV